MADFFENWFRALDEGLGKMSREECGRLFSGCAANCARDALKYLYRDLFEECKGDPDLFFSRMHEVKGVDGAVVQPGRVWEIIFLECNCDVHIRAGITCPALCECSRQSILRELKELLPDAAFDVTEEETVLRGGPRCRFRITKK